MNINKKVSIVTGAGSGIGAAVCRELAMRGAETVVLVDRRESVYELADSINSSIGRQVAEAKISDTTSENFRIQVYDEVTADHGVVSICVPAAGITRDALAVAVSKETGKAECYSIATFREVTEVNLIAPIYWAIEMIARIAEDRAARSEALGARGVPRGARRQEHAATAKRRSFSFP